MRARLTRTFWRANGTGSITRLFWKNWVKEGEIIIHGYITPRDKAGIGVEMDEEVAKKAQMPETTRFEAEK
jgi:L-alanine-DL-glutamate epimerase-like enolase superfamily enzyme